MAGALRIQTYRTKYGTLFTGLIGKWRFHSAGLQPDCGQGQGGNSGEEIGASENVGEEEHI